MEELDAVQNSPKPTHAGVEFPKYFTARLEAGKTPYDEVQWETRTATIGNDKGSVIFEQRDIEVPCDWSQTATNIVASKYFHGKLGSPERERSVGELVHRVVDTIADWGIKDGYFATPQDGENFRNELAHLMLHAQLGEQLESVLERAHVARRQRARVAGSRGSSPARGAISFRYSPIASGSQIRRFPLISAGTRIDGDSSRTSARWAGSSSATASSTKSTPANFAISQPRSDHDE